MSRRFSSKHRRVPSFSETNPYQGTTLPLPPGRRSHHHKTTPPKEKNYYKNAPVYQNQRDSYVNPTSIDTGVSDTDATYYEFYQDHHYPNHLPIDSRITDYTYSDCSGSTRLSPYETDAVPLSRPPQNRGYNERSSQRRSSGKRKDVPNVHSVNIPTDLRRVYPNDDGWDRLYHEIPSPCDIPSVPTNQLRRIPLPVSRLSDRPQSSMSSGVTSAIVDGCGGKCQTFENVCYFFLQLVFTMGILIGVSLCIAGVVLRKSAARNLQALVYIGVLVSLVSALLLGIQCNARRNAKNRKKALRNAKRAPIQMETLFPRNGNILLQQRPLIKLPEDDAQRLQIPHISNTIQRPLPQRPDDEGEMDEQGIPWWRRKDIS